MKPYQLQFFTEQRNDRAEGMRRLLDDQFPNGYNVSGGYGVWQGTLENALTITVIASFDTPQAANNRADNVAERIAKMNLQDAVLTTVTQLGYAQLVTSTGSKAEV